ncbi:MAG: sensor histidine kinase [Solirubrobacterales bacterium]
MSSDDEVVRLRREVDELRAEVEELRGDRARLISEVLGAEERERARVAQALHDDALQSLLAAHQDLIEAAPGRAQVTRAHEIMGVAIERVRDAVSALHPVILERGGLHVALKAVCSQAEKRAGLSCELSVDPAAVGPTDGLVFSIARELVTNAARHADAGQVAVEVAAGDGQVALTVTDDGGGIQPGRRDEALGEGHIGLASIERRLEAMGGSFETTSPPGGGTRAVAMIPAG